MEKRIRVKKDLYKVLNVEKDATGEDIKKAYRKKANEVHPDKGGKEEEFVSVNKAYVVLIDPIKRAEYDRKGYVDEDLDTQTKTALQFIKIEIQHLVDEENVFYREIFTMVRKKADEVEKGNQETKKHLTKKIGHYQKVLTKIKNKGDDAFIETFIEEMIKSSKDAIAQIDSFSKVHNIVQTLLKPYSFEIIKREYEDGPISFTYTTIR